MKKVIAILLALVMVLGLAACGEKKSEETTPEPEVKDTTIKVGMVCIGNPDYAYDRNFISAAEAATERLAAKGITAEWIYKYDHPVDNDTVTTDNEELVADIMNTFINNEEVCSKLVSDEAQFSNNQAVNAKFASDPNYGSEFLGGQNDVALFAGMTDNIKWENHTIYDQLLNEGLQTALQDWYKGAIDKETALANFYKYVSETYPAIVLP